MFFFLIFLLFQLFIVSTFFFTFCNFFEFFFYFLIFLIFFDSFIFKPSHTPPHSTLKIIIFIVCLCGWVGLVRGCVGGLWGGLGRGGGVEWGVLGWACCGVCGWVIVIIIYNCCFPLLAWGIHIFLKGQKCFKTYFSPTKIKNTFKNKKVYF